MPKVYVVDTPQPNAFATGRNPEHAAVCVTTGLLRRLDQDELAGVLAHELSHVKNCDTLIMTLVASIAGAVTVLAGFACFPGGRNRILPGVFGVALATLLAPFAALLMLIAVSRGREFEADRCGAEFSGHPLGLASALRRLEVSATTANNQGVFSGLFSTHPSVEERIARLQAMAQAMGGRPMKPNLRA